MFNVFLQIWGDRPLYYEGGRYPVLEGYWGIVMYADNAMIKVHLGTTPEQIIAHMQAVLSLCNYDG